MSQEVDNTYILYVSHNKIKIDTASVTKLFSSPEVAAPQHIMLASIEHFSPDLSNQSYHE